MGGSMKKVSLLLGLVLVTNFSWAHLSEEALLNSYHEIQTALAKDQFVTALDAAKILLHDIEHWLKAAPQGHVNRPDVEKMEAGTIEFLKLTPQKEEELRNTFGILNDGLIEIIRKDHTLKAGWQLYYCLMVKKYWVQPKMEMTKMNPYMGTTMQQCGTEKPW